MKFTLLDSDSCAYCCLVENGVQRVMIEENFLRHKVSSLNHCLRFNEILIYENFCQLEREDVQEQREHRSREEDSTS